MGVAKTVQVSDKNEALIEYPYWKILAWRFIRTGLWGAASTATATGVVLKVDLSNYKIYFFALFAGLISGFCNALFMAIRDYVSQGDQTALIQKLPV